MVTGVKVAMPSAWLTTWPTDISHTTWLTSSA
jgi:hypothetical protein